MKKEIYRDSLLLRLFYETEVKPFTKYKIPYRHLYLEELEDLSNSLRYKMFKFRYSISEFIEKIANRLKK